MRPQVEGIAVLRHAARDPGGVEFATRGWILVNRDVGPTSSGPRAVSKHALERFKRIPGVVAAINGADPMNGLCAACIAGLGVAGASLMVMSAGSPAPLAWSDPVAARLADLQQTLGEGPGLDAHASGRSVSEPDVTLARPSRWVAFGPAAIQAGGAALFSFPMRLGGVRLGALTLHRTAPGELTDDQHSDAQLVADLAVTGILAIQADAPEGGPGSGLRTLVGHDAIVHQAAGMVSVQLGVGVGEALVRLRAHAFALARPLAEVAADVVSRRTRLDA